MPCAKGNIGRLVLDENLILAINCASRRACNNDPMFCAVVMALQTERGAWLNLNALYLKAIANDETFKPSPRTAINREVIRLDCAT